MKKSGLILAVILMAANASAVCFDSQNGTVQNGTVQTLETLTCAFSEIGINAENILALLLFLAIVIILMRAIQ